MSAAPSSELFGTPSLMKGPHPDDPPPRGRASPQPIHMPGLLAKDVDRLALSNMSAYSPPGRATPDNYNELIMVMLTG